MDIISHSLLGASIVANKELLLPAVIFGAGPDLINGIPVHLYMVWKLRKENKSWPEIFQILKNPHEWKKAPTWTHTTYLYLHSLYFAFLVGVAIYFLYPPWLVLTKA